MTDKGKLSVNANALRLATKNMTKWSKKSLLRFQYPSNLLHSWRMWCLDLMGYDPHGYLNFSLGKNLSLYSPVGAWLVIALKVCAYKEFEWLKTLS